ncbi:MAG: HAMP domain-containing protein [Ktedonobacteraceae bacterium]|nr:HAMP domain-containing protein [Ktedonobacteraceae bacterium]
MMFERLRELTRPGIRTQLTLWYTLVSAVLILIFGIAFYTSSEQLQTRSLDTILQLRAQQVAEGVTVSNGEMTVDDVVNELPELDANAALIDTPDSDSQILHSNTHKDRSKASNLNVAYPDRSIMVRIFDARGKVIYSTASFSKIPVPPDSIQHPLKGHPWPGTVTSPMQSVRLYSTMLTDRQHVVGVVQVGQSLAKLNASLQSILTGLLIVTPFVLLLSAFGSYWLAGRAFKPIHRLAHTAREIGAKDLSQRVPVPLPKDEVRDLSIIFNQMIERLEKAFAQQHRFVADASHELRTPVSVIRSMTELAISQPSNAEDNLLVLREVNAESERLGRLISDLFALARADEGQVKLDCEPVRLDLLAADVVSSLESLADEREVTLHADDLNPATVLGDAARLIQIIMGLVDNALTYTNAGGSVALSVKSSASYACLIVRDTGIGIAKSDIDHIFERFYRADPARSKAVGGSGLGLSIVNWLVQAHGGTISVESEPGKGSTFTVKFPLAPQKPLR